MKKLLFHKNKLLKFETYKSTCPCWNEEFDEEKCLHPESIVSCKINNSFKDDPPDIIEALMCPHKQFWGSVGISKSLMTRKNYEYLLKNHTYCLHPDEIEKKKEWRCYKCNATVDSEKEKHC